jgi:SNF2 family DNA or RNA helicase
MGIRERDGAYEARWEPVFLGPDAERLTKLAQAMPPVCRSLAADRAPAPEVPAATVLGEFLGDVVDCLVREASAPPPMPAAKARRLPQFDSLHDAWLCALRRHDGALEGDARALAEFAAQVRAWQRPLTVATAPPFRLCFRLDEPGAETEEKRSRGPEQWEVRYLLQAADDPSLLVPAEAAWQAKGATARLLRRRQFSAREYLLSALGQASGLSPEIEASLKTAAPGGCALDDTRAFEFLSATAPALEQAGFGVMLPAWWTRKGTKLRLAARAKVAAPAMQAASTLSLGSLVKVDWEVTLGEEKLSLRELEALAKLKAPLVRLRGQWVHMSREEIEAALAFWKRRSETETTVRDVVQMALGSGSAPGEMAFDGVEASGWVGELLAQLEGRARFEELACPGAFSGDLRPYQARGYSWLAFLRQWGLGACLADDMGLGKTIQALALIQRDWSADGKRPVLLICPTSVVGNWQKEAARFTPDLPVMVHHGIGRAKGDSFVATAQEHALVISSYALLHRDAEHLQRVSWAGVILDEAQNVKNASTKQSRAARALQADYRVALTGTPVENNVGDLWSIMEFLNPGFLGNQTAFREQFFVPIQTRSDPGAAERLKRLTGPFILRRLKTDRSIIADLPEKMEAKVFCTLTKEQASLYRAVTAEAEAALAGVSGIERRGLVLATLMKLKQVCNHPAQLLGDNSSIPGRSGKLARLTEMVEEVLAVGERALIFSQFTEMGHLLVRHLQETFGQEALFLHGGVPKVKRDRMVALFQSGGEAPPLFVLSLKAGGTGLNLTAASHVFHFDRWWNPAVENQATDRAFRIGQTRNVQVHKFLCVGTFEETIDEMIEKKQGVAASVVGTGEGWLTELSTAELKALFGLREGAVAG